MKLDISRRQVYRAIARVEAGESHLQKKGAGRPRKLTKASVPVEKYLALKEALTLSDSRVQQLLLSNRDLKQEIALLQNMVRKLMHENLSLRKMKGMEIPPFTGELNENPKSE